MSERVMPRDAIFQKTVMADDDQQTVWNKTQDRNDNAEMSDMKTYHQGTLPAEIAGIQDGTKQLNPRSFTSGRFDSQELLSAALSVTGWYTIAETEAVGFEVISSTFDIIAGGASRVHGMKCRVVCAGGASVKTHNNNTIEIIGVALQTAAGISGIRLVKSDTVNDAGFKIQANFSPSTTISALLKIDNTGHSQVVGVEKGFFLVTPYLDNTPTLPDGVTAGTFLEAGEELSFNPFSTMFSPRVSGRKVTNDAIDVVVSWPEIPKQGTGLTITDPANVAFRDTSAATGTLSGSHTISNYTQDGKNIMFRINETGVFTGLAAGVLLSMQVTSSNAMFTIT